MDKILFEDIHPFVRSAKKYVVDMKLYSEVANYDNLLIYVQKNNAEIEVDNTSYVLERGDALIIKPGVYYKFNALSSDCVCVLIDFDYTSNYRNLNFKNLYDRQDVFNSKKIIENLCFTNLSSFNTTVYVKKMQLCEDMLIEIVKEYSNRGFYSSMKADGLMKSILSDVARRLKTNMIENNDNLRIIDDILTYINEHSNENLTNRTIGNLFALHPNHVNALVKRETGYTLHNYLLTCRLARAIELLDESTLPVYEISEKCGFSESKNFIRYFKNAVGVTPHQYRKRK